MMFVTRSPMGDIDSFHWLGVNGEHYPIYSYHRLYDYLDSLLIDYRGLIGEGLAVSNHAVKCDPYE